MASRATKRRRERAADEPLARLAGRGLAAGRLAIGAGIWLMPKSAGRALGFDVARADTRALARLAGTRDLVLGAMAWQAVGTPGPMRATVLANAAADAGDAATFAIALARREGIDRAAAAGLVSASVATATGLWLASRLG